MKDWMRDTPARSPGWCTFCIKVDTPACSGGAHSATIGWREQKDYFAQRWLTIGEYSRVLLVLSNLSDLSSRGGGVTLRRASHLSSHLWDIKVGKRLSPRLFLGPEPRASSSRSVQPASRDDDGRTDGGSAGYTRGA